MSMTNETCHRDLFHPVNIVKGDLASKFLYILCTLILCEFIRLQLAESEISEFIKIFNDYYVVRYLRE